jgi:hypothetical protein
MVLEGGLIMSKYRVELELDYTVTLEPNIKRINSKSYENAVKRLMITEVIQVALADKGLQADVYQVRKVNS